MHMAGLKQEHKWELWALRSQTGEQDGSSYKQPLSKGNGLVFPYTLTTPEPGAEVQEPRGGSFCPAELIASGDAAAKGLFSRFDCGQRSSASISQL